MKLGRAHAGLQRRYSFLVRLYWQLYMIRELQPQHVRFEINCQLILIEWEMRELEGQL